MFAAITTPFYPDERLYLRKLEANVARYSRSLLAGMVVLGSTGEGVELNDEETREVLTTAAEAAARQDRVLAPDLASVPQGFRQDDRSEAEGGGTRRSPRGRVTGFRTASLY